VEKAPWSWTARDTQAGLSMVGGDGAVVRGGEGRETKPGTSAAEYCWMRAHPELMWNRGDEDDLALAALTEA